MCRERLTVTVVAHSCVNQHIAMLCITGSKNAQSLKFTTGQADTDTWSWSVTSPPDSSSLVFFQRAGFHDDWASLQYPLSAVVSDLTVINYKSCCPWIDTHRLLTPLFACCQGQPEKRHYRTYISFSSVIILCKAGFVLHRYYLKYCIIIARVLPVTLGYYNIDSLKCSLL